MYPDLRGVGTSTDPASIGATPEWVKVGAALPFTAFQTAALTKTNTLFSLIAGGIVHAVKIKHSASFTGGAIASCTMSVGIAGTVDKYASAFDVFQAVSGTAFELSDALGSESHTAATNITITATSTVANLAALTTGTVDVWALLSVAN